MFDAKLEVEVDDQSLRGAGKKSDIWQDEPASTRLKYKAIQDAAVNLYAANALQYRNSEDWSPSMTEDQFTYLKEVTKTAMCMVF